MTTGYDDLPLFRWTPPIAQTIPFPAGRRVGKIRRTAEALCFCTPKGAAAYWRRTIGDLERQMRLAGVTEERAAAEIHAFREAVRCELARDGWRLPDFAEAAEDLDAASDRGAPAA